MVLYAMDGTETIVVIQKIGFSPSIGKRASNSAADAESIRYFFFLRPLPPR
jgi:hypothetical protein